MTISEAMAYIQGYQKSGKPVHDLSRIQALLDAIGNPQEQLQVIHIAGTNGKGSVTAFCAAAATAAGFRTGTLTSPFIQHYTDRIQIDGQDIPGEALCRFCEQVKACPVSADCSQFEITFAIALLWFLEQHCDLVVLETGIGGLLDATNVVKKPLVCAITSVSFDHMALLGNTLTEIAAQKAGIIKQGCPVVLSTDNPMDVVCLVQETAKQKNAQLVIPNMQDCRILSETLEETVFQYHSFTYTLHMPGRHQVYNAMTAIEVIRFLGMHGYLITAAVANDAFSKVRVPARTELLRKDPMVLLDGGHNQAGVMALADLLRSAGQKPIHGICGMISTKDYHTACQILGGVLDTVTCVDDFVQNAVPREELAACFADHAGVQTAASFQAAYADALAQVRATGYGIVMPDASELHLEKPEIVRKNGGYAVRLKASAPSIHLLRADVETELSPMVGGEQESEQLIRYLLSEYEEDTEKLWESNLFGKSLYELVSEGLSGKLARMPDDVRAKLRRTLCRMINENTGGMICILL